MISFILTLPFTLIGILVAIISGPINVRLNKKPRAVIIDIKKFWWGFGYMKYSRAMTIGSAVLLGPKLLKNDLEHELIHVKQQQKYLFLFPFLYYLELFKKGYRKNKFEDEAYKLSNSTYLGRPLS